MSLPHREEVNPMADNATLVVEALRLATAAVTFAAALVGLSATTRQSHAEKGRRKKKSHRR